MGALTQHIDYDSCLDRNDILEVSLMAMKLKHAAGPPAEDGSPNSQDDGFKGETTADKTSNPATPDDSGSNSEEDLLIFDPPCSNGLSKDNPWSTEQNYDLIDFDIEGEGKEVSEYDKASKTTADLLSPQVGKSVESDAHSHAQGSTPSIPALKLDIQPASKPETKPEAKAGEEGEDVEWTEEKIREQLLRSKKAKAEANKSNPFHPTCPEFDVRKHWNSVVHKYQCPYLGCG